MDLYDKENFIIGFLRWDDRYFSDIRGPNFPSLVDFIDNKAVQWLYNYNAEWQARNARNILSVQLIFCFLSRFCVYYWFNISSPIFSKLLWLLPWSARAIWCPATLAAAMYSELMNLFFTLQQVAVPCALPPSDYLPFLAGRGDRGMIYQFPLYFMAPLLTFGSLFKGTLVLNYLGLPYSDISRLEYSMIFESGITLSFLSDSFLPWCSWPHAPFPYISCFCSTSGWLFTSPHLCYIISLSTR